MLRTPEIGAQAKNGKSGHQAQLKPHPAAAASARTAAARPDSGLLELQRLAGNQVVAQLLKRPAPEERRHAEGTPSHFPRREGRWR